MRPYDPFTIKLKQVVPCQCPICCPCLCNPCDMQHQTCQIECQTLSGCQVNMWCVISDAHFIAQWSLQVIVFHVEVLHHCTQIHVSPGGQEYWPCKASEIFLAATDGILLCSVSMKNVHCRSARGRCPSVWMPGISCGDLLLVQNLEKAVIRSRVSFTFASRRWSALYLFGCLHLSY